MRQVTVLEPGPAAGTASPERGRLSRGIWVAATAAALLQLACAVPFMRAQSIWSDETTQIAGLSLPPAEVARWLAGEAPDRFAVPNDRMPPLSYWIGWTWARMFGATETSYRWMGLAVTACATACVALAAGRLAGARGALASGFLFALSPNVMAVAPEIRAYPFFLLFSAAASLSLIGYAQARREAEVRWLIACLACSLAATYSHFFGLVLGGAVFASATLVALAGRRHVARPILGGMALLAMSAGILPFARASSSVSVEDRSDSLVETLVMFARMVTRSILNPAAMVDPPVAGLLLVGMVGLIGLGLWLRPAHESDGLSARWPVRLDLVALPLALAAGLGVTLLAGLTVRSFFVLRSSYSLWTLPGLFILAGAAFAPGLTRRLGTPAAALAAIALAAEAWSVGLILAHAETFSHGPAAAIERLIGSAAGDRPPIIVHETGPYWSFLYFPIRLEHGTELEQYLAPASGEGPPRRWPLEPLAGATRPTSLEDLPRDRRILVLRGSLMGQRDFRRELRGGGAVVPAGPLIEDLASDPAWAVERELRFLAYTSVQGRLYAPRSGPTAARGGHEPGRPSPVDVPSEHRP